MAQSNSYHLKGSVNTKEKKPLEFGNAVILNIKDSTLIKGAPFENGEFEIVAIQKDSVILKITSKSNIPLYSIEYRSPYNTHYYMLALNYKFGRLKNSTYKNKLVSDEEYSRIKMGK